MPGFFDATLRGRDGRWPHPVCRLGLATRGDTHLTAPDILYAIERGVNFINWCGTPNSLCEVVARLGARREQLVLCVQFEARTAQEAEREFNHILVQLGTPYVDVLTFYYVEEADEWQQIIGPGGSLETCIAEKRAGRVRLIGLTSHQRQLAASAAQSGLLDLLMVRYNAAHRGAEAEVFPVTDALGLPVVIYTCLRWGALLRSTPEDPHGFQVPRAPAWYRFALQSPAVTVALSAPDNRDELEEDLTVLEFHGPLPAEEYSVLAEHGQRVRKFAGNFP
jgi:predicted aldo/keto reductase-like oxidoreductase